MKNYRINNLKSNRPNYGFSLNPLDYYDFPNPLEYLPIEILEFLGEEGYITEEKLRQILANESDNHDVLTGKLYTTRNIFQYWSLQFKFLLDTTTVPQNISERQYKKLIKKYKDFGDLLKGYSLYEPENVNYYNLLLETNNYLQSLGNFYFPKDKELIKNIHNEVYLKLDKTGDTVPLGKAEEDKYKKNRKLLNEFRLKRSLAIGIPTISLIGILIYLNK